MDLTVSLSQEERIMAETNRKSDISIGKLILIPSIITLGITLLRLIGELQDWSALLFNKTAGGGFAIIGITWLVPLFGVYFAIKLARTGDTPSSAGRVLLFALLGIAVTVIGGFLGFGNLVDFPGKQLVGVLIVAVGGLVPLRAWPTLFKTLIAYGYAARIPVAIIMFFAIRGQWGTHYDVLPPDFPSDLGFWQTYIQIGAIPQLIMWIAFTTIIGSLFGGIAYAVTHRSGAPAQTTAPA